MKLGIALVIGQGRFRLLTGAGLAAMAAALGAILIWT
jgi:hypothetical protein